MTGDGPVVSQKESLPGWTKRSERLSFLWTWRREGQGDGQSRAGGPGVAVGGAGSTDDAGAAPFLGMGPTDRPDSSITLDELENKRD